MSDVKISVIMPVYKVEKYIRKAIESIQNQTFNPIDKIVELYERLLKAEQEKVAMLHEIIKDK